jgi:hypothetical protein
MVLFRSRTARNIRIPGFPEERAHQLLGGTIMVEVRISSVVIRPNIEKEEAHKAKMQEVGECIVRNPPPWLRDVLSHFSFDVRWADSVETTWPTRSQMWDSLVETSARAVELSNLLHNSAMVAFLSTNSDFDSDEVAELTNSLSKLVVSAGQARKAPQLVGSDGNILPGRGKPLLSQHMPAKYVCAAIIAEVWAFFNGKDPAPSNRRAWTAADKFWHSWFPSESWGNDPLTSWKRYFESVRDPKLEPLRREVLRWLKIHTHQAAVMLEK